MIKSFRHKGLKQLYTDDNGRLLPSDMIASIRTILAALDSAKTLEELNRPSFRLHPLKGDLKGFKSITVRANWRIIFRFEGEYVLDVDFTDYH